MLMIDRTLHMLLEKDRLKALKRAEVVGAGNRFLNSMYRLLVCQPVLLARA